MVPWLILGGDPHEAERGNKNNLNRGGDVTASELAVHRIPIHLSVAEPRCADIVAQVAVECVEAGGSS